MASPTSLPDRFRCPSFSRRCVHSTIKRCRDGLSLDFAVMNRIEPMARKLTSFLWILSLCCTATGLSGAEQPPPGLVKGFLGPPVMESQVLFEDERFPNVVVATDGTVLATWGSQHLRVRRSEDGGQSWGPEIAVSDGIHAGGAIVDEVRRDVLLFVHPKHPPTDGAPAPRTLYRSTDHGATWSAVDASFPEDANGFVPSLHMSEHGITLHHQPHAGRLIRPARVYRHTPDRYSTAIYSDDGGKTWLPSEPVPIQGSGEGALLALEDGQLIYTARRSYFADGQEFVPERHYASSSDGGETWKNPARFAALPDGPRYRGQKKQGANYNGHFGMMAGFLRLPVGGRDILLYSNADHDGYERVRLTVWASFDGGQTWPVKRLIHEGPSAYSSLAAGRPDTPSEGQIYLQYEFGEEGRQYAGCRLARFNLSWLLEGELTGDGQVPDEFRRDK